MASGDIPVWQSPSGRLHRQRTCSGGGAGRMTRVSLSPAELRERWNSAVAAGDPSQVICKCALISVHRVLAELKAQEGTIT